MNKLRIAGAVSVLLLVLSLCGCIRYVELSDRAIVQAMGVDYLPDKGIYRISMQYFAQSSEGSKNQIDKTQANVLKSIGEGKSILQAVNNASLLTGKALLLSENRIIILGKEACRLDLKGIMEFFISNFHSHPQTYFACGENTAEEILDIRFKEGYVSSQHLIDIIDNAAALGKSSNEYAYTTMAQLMGGTKSTVLPLLKTEELATDGTIPPGGGNSSGGSGDKKEQQKETTVVPCGVVIFSDGTAKDKADEDVTMGIRLFYNAVEEITITINTDNNRTAALTLYDICTEITPRSIGDTLTFEVNTTAHARFDDRGSIGEVDTKGIEDAISKAESEIEACMKKALDKAKGCRADIFGLENALRNKNPEYYRAVKDNIGDVLFSAEFNLKAKCLPFSLGLQSF